MLRSNMRLALGSLAAMAVGLAGGWALFAVRPVQASTPAMVETASQSIMTAPSADAPARTPARWATPTAPAPAQPPTVASPPPTPAPSPDAASSKDEAGKPRIHLDGERSAFSYDGEAGSLYINKDRLSVRTPFGKFD